MWPNYEAPGSKVMIFTIKISFILDVLFTKNSKNCLFSFQKELKI